MSCLTKQEEHMLQKLQNIMNHALNQIHDVAKKYHKDESLLVATALVATLEETGFSSNAIRVLLDMAEETEEEET